MKVEEEYILKLTRAEAEALKILIGKTSHSYRRKELELSEELTESLSDLYDALPYQEEE